MTLTTNNGLRKSSRIKNVPVMEKVQPGRKRKAVPKVDKENLGELATEAPVARKRGRPPKVPEEQLPALKKLKTVQEGDIPKKKLGRPKKLPVEEDPVIEKITKQATGPTAEPSPVSGPSVPQAQAEVPVTTSRGKRLQTRGSQKGKYCRRCIEMNFFNSPSF